MKYILLFLLVSLVCGIIFLVVLWYEDSQFEKRNKK